MKEIKQIISTIFSPRNVLIAFVAVVLLGWTIGDIRGSSEIVFYLWIFIWYAHPAIFIISIVNAVRFYRVNWWQFAFSLIPLAMYGFVFVRLLILYFTCPIWDFRGTEEW